MEAFLDNVLRWLISFNTGIFVLLGLGILLYLRKFVIGLQEWQKSVFGLERKISQRKLVSATTGLMLLVLLVIGEFFLVTVIGPQMPAALREGNGTIDPIASPTTTLPEGDQAIAPVATQSLMQASLESECIEGQLEISSPEAGEIVSGNVQIVGTVNFEDFGYYKYEYSTIGTVNWITIAAEDQLKLDEVLGNWNTSNLTPGPYLLQLMPLNNVGEELIPCIINVEVISEE